MSSKTVNIIAFLLGLGLLGWFIYYTGPSRLLDNLLTVGWGFLWVLLVFFVEVLMEVGAWYYALPPEHRTSYFAMFSASVAGSTMNALLPGGQAGEVLKGNLLAGLVPMEHIVSSLMIYNFMYTETTLVVLAVASFVCTLTGEVKLELGLAMFGGVIVSSTLLLAIFYWLRRGAITDILKISRKIPVLRNKITDKAILRGKEIDEGIRSFRHKRPSDYTKTFVLLTLARVMGIVEVWVILLLLEHPIPFIKAAGIFTAGQLFYYITLFLPTRIGVLEGGAIGIFEVFGLPGQLGLAMEVVRRLRKLAYNVIGVVLLGWLGVYKKGRE